MSIIKIVNLKNRKQLIFLFVLLIVNGWIYSRFYNIREYDNTPNKFILVSEAKNGFTEARIQAILECGLGRHHFCIRPLGDNLKDNNDRIRQMSARNLGFIRDERALDYLYEAAENEKNIHIKADIIWAIGYIGNPKSIDIIDKYLESEHWQLRNATAEAYGYMKAHQKKEKLASLLEKEEHFRVKISLLATLIILTPDNTEYRKKLIDFVKSNHPEERYYVAMALEKLKLKEALKPLKDALEIEGEEAVRNKLRRAFFIIKNHPESLMQ